MNKTLTILAGLGLVTAGAIIGNELIGDAQAASGGTATLTPEECALVEAAWGGDCSEHAQARVDGLVLDAERQVQANRAAGVELLDAADIEALDAKIKVKKDALKIEEQEPE